MKKRMHYLIIVLLCFLFCLGSSMTVFAASVTELSETGTVTSETLNVRSGPSQDEKAIGKLYQGDTVTITGQADNGWYQIDYFNEEGYVSGKYVSIGGSEEKSTSASTDENGTQESLEDYEKYVPGESQATDLFAEYKLIVVAAVIVVVVILIFITLHGIRKLDEDEDDEDEYYERPVRKKKVKKEPTPVKKKVREPEPSKKKVREPEPAKKKVREPEPRKKAEPVRRRVADEQPVRRKSVEAEPVRRKSVEGRSRVSDPYAEPRREAEDPRISSARRAREEKVPMNTADLDIENFRVDVNPSFFEEEDQVRKQINEPLLKNQAVADESTSGKEKAEDLDEAMAKLAALQKEIEEIKKNQQ